MYRAYAGGTGHNETETSIDAEPWRNEITDKFQIAAMEHLKRRRVKGATSEEVGRWLGEEKGRLGTALTNLHIGGKVERLRSRRNNHYVYVLPHFVLGRRIKPYMPQGTLLHTVDAIVRAEQLSEYLADRTKFGEAEKPGDHELSRLLRRVASRSRKRMELDRD